MWTNLWIFDVIRKLQTAQNVYKSPLERLWGGSRCVSMKICGKFKIWWHMHNHVQTRVPSGAPFFEKLPRSRSVSFARSDFGIRASVLNIFTQKYSQNHRGRPSTHGSPIGAGRRSKKKYFFRCPEKLFFCGLSMSTFWCISLISWNWETLEGSISAPGTLRTQRAVN